MNKRMEKFLKPNVGVQFFALIGFSVVALLFEQYILAVVELGVTALLFVGYLTHRNHKQKQIESFARRMEDDVNDREGVRAPFPMVLMRVADGGIVYANDSFTALTEFNDIFTEKNISEFIPDFKTDWLVSGKAEYPYDVAIRDRRYRVYGYMLPTDETGSITIGALYFADLTELYQVHDEYISSRPVVSLVVVDNYDELTRNMSEAAISGLNARLNNTIMKWAQEYHGLLRRLEKNRFLLIFEKRDLKHMRETKFSLLEQIHEITAPSGLAASISFGIGVDGATFEEGFEFASLSIEMALSRGGDQAVVKDRTNFHFFGGRTKETDSRSKVRSRVTANTLMELIGQSSYVFIMGHKNADLDSLGAAMGVACLCRKKNKPVHIVIDLENNSSKRLIDEILEEPEYRNIFITGEEALVMCDNRSTLIVVDTNRPDQVEYRPLLEASTRVCVIDHHLRAADYIQSAAVNFHEPHASSTAELVTELLEYSVEQKDVLPIEAKSLMAGIYLDTKNFNVRTGERTFEAAAYLRQLGVDTIAVKKLFQYDFQSAIAKHKIVEAARMHRNGIAIAPLKGNTTRALAAQAADEILNINGVTTSFVLFADDDKVLISARSIGEVNVQVILEKLGGGGNAATAGAQLSDKTVAQALQDLKNAIDQYFGETIEGEEK